MTSGTLIGIAVGTFFGNWLVCPLIFKGWSHRDGFFIGLIAATLIGLAGLTAGI